MIPFFAFRIMVGMGLVMLAVSWLGNLLRFTVRLESSRWFLWAAFLSFPSGFIAVLTGWFTAEVGRQPWVVYGLLRTKDAVTPSLRGSDVLFSLCVYVVVYTVISFGAWTIYKLLRDGPRGEDAEVPDNAAVGAMMHGIPVANSQFAGGAFDWLRPFPLLTGIGLVFGYALLGAGWLAMKCEGPLRELAFKRIPWLAGAMLLVLGVAFGLTLDYSDIAKSNLMARSWGLAFPLIGVLALVGILLGTRRRHDVLPFAMTVLFFLSAFLTLGVMYWPYMVPYAITVADAAGPEASLSFLFWGAGLFVLPVIVVYTVAVYWIFRGKVRAGHG